MITKENKSEKKGKSQNQMNQKNHSSDIIPELRFPEFVNEGEWDYLNGDELFGPISNKNHSSDFPILAITQEQGAIPRNMIDYHVSVTDKSVESYKVVEVGDFIISLRSFQGGIEYSNYLGLCSPAYIILRRKIDIENDFYRHYFKSIPFIRDLNRNLEGIRDGKMVSYSQFSEILIPKPLKNEQQKIASCLSSLDEVIAANSQKLELLKEHKKGLMQNLFPQNSLNHDFKELMDDLDFKNNKKSNNQNNQKNQGSDNVPKLRFPEFINDEKWKKSSVELLIKENILYAPKDGNHGNLHPKSSDYVKTGIPFIMASDLRNGKVDFSNCAYLKMEQADKLQKGFSKSGDVLLTHKGTVGEVALVDEIEFPYIMLTPQVTYYRIKDKSIIVKTYLAAFLNSDLYQKSLFNVSGGGTRAYVGITEQQKLEIVYPNNINEQQKIASCLSSLDELITAQSEKIEQLKLHKKGLMQGLFPKMND